MPKTLNHLSQELKIPSLVLMNDEQKSSDEAQKGFFDAMNIEETEEVIFTIKLGHVLFDLYTSTLEKPVAPLLVKKQESELQDLANKFHSSEVLEIPEKVVTALESVLSDDEKFQATAVHAFFTNKDGKENALPLSARVIYSVPGILNAILSLFDEKEEASE